MPLKMIEPTKHSKTGIYRVRLTIPAELRATTQQLYGVGAEFTTNLNTKDKREALKRAPAAEAELRTKLEMARTLHLVGPKALSRREISALAGAWYRQAVGLNEDDPGSYEGWDAYRDELLDAQTFPDGDPASNAQQPTYEPDEDALREARTLLVDKGIAADAMSVEALASALWVTKLNFADLMMRRANGDYRPDDYPTRFAALPDAKPSDTGETVEFDAIVRGSAIDNGHNPDAKPIPRAYYDRHRTAERLAAFVGHRTVSLVTKADAVRWKEDMQSKGKAASTVANDISELSAIWKWAIAHGRATDNPFAGILPPKKARNRKGKRRPFTDAEAALILSAARSERGALRWLPWVLAATGARLTEICQAVKQDVFIQDGLHFIRIHQDTEVRAAGEAQRSVKNEGSERMVPVHPVLQQEGFLAYVAALPARSPLFPDILPDSTFGSRGASAQKLVSRWLRKTLVIDDKQVSPNHSWRHWWIDKARKALMHPEVRHAITGHAHDSNESHGYGLGWQALPKVLADAMETITFPPLE